MALKLEVTDNKGVKARYHRVRSLEFGGGKIKVTLFGYVNQATRDSEKNALDGNAKARAYEDNLASLRAELNDIIGNTEQEERVVELTNQINELELATDKPKFTEVVDTHYSEDEVEIDYLEAMTLEGVYTKLAESGKYGGAERI
jgi:hypothetical protein